MYIDENKILWDEIQGQDRDLKLSQPHDLLSPPFPLSNTFDLLLLVNK